MRGARIHLEGIMILTSSSSFDHSQNTESFNLRERREANECYEHLICG